MTQLAVDYRNQFNKDVVVDLVCYRRRGHNEADEPSVTQPAMYEKIKSHHSTRALYAKRLIDEGLLSDQDDSDWVEQYRKALERDEPLVSSLVSEPNKAMFVDWSPYIGHRWDVAADTAVPLGTLKILSEQFNAVPEGGAHRVSKTDVGSTQNGRRCIGSELGLCGDDGVRVVVGRRLSRQADGTRRRTGNVQPPPCSGP